MCPRDKVAHPTDPDLERPLTEEGCSSRVAQAAAGSSSSSTACARGEAAAPERAEAEQPLGQEESSSSTPPATKSTAGKGKKHIKRVRFRSVHEVLQDGPGSEDSALAAHKRRRMPQTCDVELIRAAMQSDRVCALLEESEVDAVLQSVEYFEFAAGDRVVAQGDEGNMFFVVDQGTLPVEVDGKVVNTLDRGKAFGGLALLYKCPRTASVTARIKSGCWGVSFEALHSAIEENARKRYAENRRFVESLRLFDGLSSRQKDRFAVEVFTVVLERAGERAVTQRETGSAIHFVKAGELAAWRGGAVAEDGRLKGGREALRYGPGDSFGEQAMLYQEPHLHTVIAAGRCELLCISRMSLTKVFGEDFKEFLERAFLRAGLSNSPEISYLQNSLQQELVEAMTVKRYGPSTAVDEGLRFAVVTDGSLAEEGGRRLQRGQWFEEDCAGRWAGPEGCRLGILRRDDFDRVVGADAQKAALIRKVPLFRYLSDAQAANIARCFTRARYRRGEVVFKQGDVGDTFLVIASGEARVSINGEHIRTLGVNAYFGERAVLFGEPRTATVDAASSECDVWSLTKAVFQQILCPNMRQEIQYRINLQDTDVSSLKDLRTIKKLGEGGMGVVSLVEHKASGMRYALKKVTKSQDGVLEQLLRREITLLADNDHPMVMCLIKTLDTPSHVYMLTEYISGGDLFEAIEHINRLLTRQEAQFYCGCLALVLEALSERGIVHRDLKPENVMLDAQGYPKLVDFGVAKKLEEGAGRTYSDMGTPHYMAPEVIKRTGHGVEADIWSLGVMLYDMVCGDFPFARELSARASKFEIYRSVLESELTFPTVYKDELGKVLMQSLMTRDPRRRLGCGIHGWEEIKSHAFFRAGYEHTSSQGVTLFSKIRGRELQPPYRRGQHQQLGGA